MVDINKRLLNVKEVAEYICSTPGSVYQKVHNRTIPYIKSGKSLLFDILEKHLNEYPKWNSKMSEDFIELLLSTMLEYGFKYVINDGNDALYFD